MKNYLSFVFEAFWNTLKGLWLTLKVLFLPAITVQYPTEKIVPYPRFRGMPAYDSEACIACGMCVRACPSRCIALANAVSSEGKRMPKIAWYTLDYGRCNFCGLCEESCPTKPKAVWHSLDYEAVFGTREEMVRRWKRGDDLWGTAHNSADAQFAAVTDQIHIQDVPVRK
ncbi:MAG: NADH-quinone oxidoreductase subunit I [Elusimicrobia bacterium]|nr:NADH-quinone oxidoreductase subunit I [Elusimicrobiota bacterium]